MEFNFNVNNYFRNEITIVGSRLIPDGFTGDRREIQECISRVSHVLTVLGEYSARAQGLQKVITSGEKLRNTDHIVYVLTDPQGGKRGTGSVLGMLKMGVKHLYVFDIMGTNHEVSARCVLDFYIHESKQRMGMGKKLFQYMLKEENVEPQHLAIDKPSPKFLSFLRKHYGLHATIPQMNNFVVFNGFFSNRNSGERLDGHKRSYAAGLSSNSSKYQSGRLSEYSTPILSPQAQQSSSAVDLNQSVPHFGRPAPHKPISTVGLILQHKTPSNTPQSFQPGSKSEETDNGGDAVEEPKVTVVVEENGNDDAEDEKENVPDCVVPETVEPEANGHDDLTEVTDSKPEITTKVTEPSTPIETNGNDPGMRYLTQAGKPPHLDLKFYHSSLW